MVSAWHQSGDATLRLVLDFGHPDDTAAKAPAPASGAPDARAKRKRGRPPKPRALTRL